MIKLSTFMLDPVRAHELYMKERELLTEKSTEPYIEMVAKLQKAYDRQMKKNNKLRNDVKMLENKLKGEKK